MAASLAPQPLPLSTADLPGTGGALRVFEEDFLVEEIPSYAASGEGEHLYLTIEKRGISTMQLVRTLATALGVKEREVGYAGLKDTRAVTRQRLSVPWTVARAEQATSLAADRWRVLRVERHGNKLRPGHLIGNRFCIRLRGVVADAEVRARAIFSALTVQGVPNFFGPQRFGPKEDNAILGHAVLFGLPEGKRAGADRFRRKFLLSALQSELFNRLCAERVRERSLGVALLGDVLKKRGGRGAFVCVDTVVDTPRVESGEVDPAGPMFGPEMLAATDVPGAREAQVLAETELSLAAFALGGDETEGTRRAYRVPLANVDVVSEGDALRLSFDLPRGSYATTVLREVTKESVAPEIDA